MDKNSFFTGRNQLFYQARNASYKNWTTLGEVICENCTIRGQAIRNEREMRLGLVDRPDRPALAVDDSRDAICALMNSMTSTSDSVDP
jgi:hypothetical protein